MVMIRPFVLALLLLQISVVRASPLGDAHVDLLDVSLNSLGSRGGHWQQLETRKRTCTKGAQVDQTFEGGQFDKNGISPLLGNSASSRGISYPGFSVTTMQGNRGLRPQSGISMLVTGAGHHLLSTTPAMQVSDGSDIDYFDLHSFYYGCALVTTDVVSLAGVVPNVPTACTITLKGFYQGRMIGEQQFSFDPKGTSEAFAQLVPGNCHTGFQGVDKVEYTTDNPTLKALTLDNIVYQPARCDGNPSSSSSSTKRGSGHSHNRPLRFH